MLKLKPIFNLITVLAFMTNGVHAQKNYILNGDFEKYNICPAPFQFHQIEVANNWKGPSEYIYSYFIPPDRFTSPGTEASVEYFNAKCRNGAGYWFGVPINYYSGNGPNGFRVNPHSGNGYAGASFTHFSFFNNNYRYYKTNILQGEVLPLQKNREYYFEMYVYFAHGTNLAIGSLGAMFSDTTLEACNCNSTFQFTTFTPLYGKTADIIDSTLLTTHDWYKISGKYFAKGNERYVFIGQFAADTTRIMINPSQTQWYANYYVDDVSLIDCENTSRPNVLGPDTMICNLQPFTLNAHQPDPMVNYNWSTGAKTDTLRITERGIYWVDISINGCPPTRDTIVIGMEQPPTVKLPEDTILCLTKGLIIFSNPLFEDTGYHYLWNTGETNFFISVDTVGKYSIQVSHKGCSASDTMNIYRFPLKKFELGNDTSLCTDTTFILDATTPGAEGYRWSNGDTTPIVQIHNSGTYWCEAFNGSCKYRDSIKLNLRPFPKPNLGPPIQDICDRTNFTLDAGNPGATYLWNTGDTTRTIKIINSGLYQVNVMFNGCQTIANTLIQVVPSPTVELGPDTMLCEGSPKQLDATQSKPATYLWEDNSTQATRLVNNNGKYLVYVKLANGCTASDSVNLLFDPKPLLDLGPDHAACFDQPVLLSAPNNSGLNYVWQDGSHNPTFTANQPGWYWVNVISSACIVNDSILITNLPKSFPDLGTDSILCAGSTRTLDPGSFSTYLWNTGSTAPTLQVLHPGLYQVQVKNSSGCLGLDSIQLIQKPLPYVWLGKDTSVCEPDFFLHPQQGYPTYIWNDGSGSSSYHVTGYGTFSVTVKDQFGCTNNGQITITNDCATTLFVPNAFTPNNDGTNDVFMPVGLNIKTFHMDIYNRWGQKVFTTDDITKGWNGEFNKEFGPCEVYVYRASYTNLIGAEFIKTGNVTLMR